MTSLETYFAKPCNCLSKEFDSIHYVDPLYEIYAVKKTGFHYYALDNPYNCSENYICMKIYTYLLVRSANTLFFHCKICVTALIYRDILKQSHWRIQRWIFHWYLTLICECDIQQKIGGNDGGLKNIHFIVLTCTFFLLSNNCSEWKSLTSLATECKCSITKKIRESQFQGPIFQFCKQSPQQGVQKTKMFKVWNAVYW